MLVYRVTNTVNGKVYIGKYEGSNVSRRWKEHRYRARRGSPYYFHSAIRKYGAEAFAVEVLHRAKTREELRQTETFFVLLHQSHNRKYGYNLTLGGEGVSPNEATRQKMSGPNHHQYGKPLSEETRKKISLAMRGGTRTIEHRQKISATLKGRRHTSVKQLRSNLGAGFSGHKHSEESKLKMSLAKSRRQDVQTCA